MKWPWSRTKRAEHRRTPLVAGHLYPSDPAELEAALEGYAASASAPEAHAGAARGAIVPDGELTFTGALAAPAWLSARAAGADRVVIVGAAQRIPFAGAGFGSFEAWESPLGDIECDASAAKRAALLHERARLLDAAQRGEYGLELPMIWARWALERAALVPLYMGDGPAAWLAPILDEFWDDETFVVVVSALARDEPRAQIEALGAEADRAIVARDGAALSRAHLSALSPVRAWLEVCAARGFEVHSVGRVVESGVAAPGEARSEGAAGFGSWIARGA